LLFRKDRIVGLKPYFVLLLLATAPAISSQGRSSQLPEGKGKDALRKICANCHEIETVIASRRTRIGWERSVDDMISRGAEGSDEEMDAVVEYLATFFGKINVNTASVEDMQKSLGLSGKDAQAIAVYREQKGKFKDFEQLKNVPGVNREKLQAKRSRIAFTL